MEMVSKFSIGLVDIIHLYILFIEMFAWESKGKIAFKGVLPKELFAPTKSLAANLGLYNGFLAAGLIWTFFISDEIWSKNISIFFLLAVFISGVYGTLTATKKILYVQVVPSTLALISVFLS